MGASNSTNFGKTSVYKIVKGVDETGETGETGAEGVEEKILIRPGYYKNNSGIYYDGLSLNLSKKERSSFKKLKYSYAKSMNYVFYKGQKIEGADPKTFITINRKNMPEEFKKLNSVIGMDFVISKRIYQFGIKIFEVKL